MSELLHIGQVVESNSGQPCKVLAFLGGGGQGEVYRAQWGGIDVALKWYFETSATHEQRATIQALVDEGKPSDRFLWPEDLASSSDVAGFGYIMGLRSPQYRSLTDLVSGKVQPSFLALITSGFELTKAFRSLHNKGLCYRDISFGNAFFDPDSGEVLICDNDNVGVNRKSPTGVLGTPDFMAPEIVRSETYPSTKTDNHSLAVLLFYMLCIGHPLQGKRMLSIRAWDRPARELLFGREPVFIFDPNDQSNAAVSKSQDPTGEAGGTALRYWELFPRFLRDTFIKAFTVGLRDPDARVTELEWQDTLVKLRNSLFRCRCDTPNFYDASVVDSSGGRPAPCWHCGKVPDLPFRMRLGRDVVMLNADSKFYPHHFNGGYDFSTSVAEVVRHPSDPNIWGLKNLSAGKWVATFGDGTMKDIERGRSVPLASGVRVNFGSIEGEIRY